MFGARYYASTMGRFMVPDWAAKPTDVPYANFGNPQSLNLYSYVENNPTTLGDPDGHCGEAALTDAANNCPETEANGHNAQEAANLDLRPPHCICAGPGSWWKSLTGTIAVGVARISPSAARKIWEAANPGETVPFDAVRGRFYDMAHIKALADGGTNAAENLKPQEHGEHMAEHMANGDFARFGSRARQVLSNAGQQVEAGAEEMGEAFKEGYQESAQSVREMATEAIQNPGEAAKDAATTIIESVKSGDVPIE